MDHLTRQEAALFDRLSDGRNHSVADLYEAMDSVAGSLVHVRWVVGRIRKKLGPTSIINVHGVGYRAPTGLCPYCGSELGTDVAE